jgi:hypothetical protein
MVMVAVNHGVMAHDVVMAPHHVMMVMVVMMVNRARRSHARRQGEGDRRRERQGHEFQDLPPD